MKLKFKHSKTTYVSLFTWLTTIGIFGALAVYTSYKPGQMLSTFETGIMIFDVLLGVVSFLLLFISVIVDTVKFHRLKNNSKLQQASVIIDDSSISGRMQAGLEDIIFVPQKNNTVKVIFIIVLVIVIGFIALILFSANESSQQTTSISNESDEVNLYNIYINEPKMEWEYKELYFTGTLKNLNNYHVNNVKVRIDFYWDKETTKLFDTRYVTLSGAPSNGAFTFGVPVQVYPESQFWYKSNIEGAEK